MTIPIPPHQFKAYLGARGIRWAPETQAVTCTSCEATWAFDATPMWWRCPRGCGDRLDGYPTSATAGRMLSAHPPLPYTPFGASADAPVSADHTRATNAAVPANRKGGRPRGGIITAAQVQTALRALAAELGHRPTMRAVAQRLGVSEDTVRDALRREGQRFSDLPHV